MQSKLNRFVLMVLFMFSLGAAWVTTAFAEETPADLIKKIEQAFSGIQRRIATEPSRAEKEWLDAQSSLDRLKTIGTEDAPWDALQKRNADLKDKLEKRLGRSVGSPAAADQPARQEVKPQPGQAPDAAASQLPSAVTSRLDKLNGALDAVEVALAKEQLQTAERKFSEAQKIMDEIQTRYGDKIPQGDSQFKAALDRLTTVGANLSTAQAAAAAAAAQAAENERQMQEQSKAWIDRLSPFVDYKNELYLRIGSEFNNAEEAEKALCRQAFAQANALMDEYKEAEFPYGKTMELRYLQQQIAGRVMIYNETELRDQREQACREWVDALREYVDVGAGSPKYLIASVTFCEDQIREQSALLKEAQSLWQNYQQAQFPLGKTDQLLHLEKVMQQRFDEMPEMLRQSQALISGDLDKEFDGLLERLRRPPLGADKKPPIIMERDIEPLREALDRYAATVDKDDTSLASLKQKLAQVEQADQANRARRAELTFMRPDAFRGADADALVSPIQAIVKKQFPQAQILRIAKPAPDWKMEDVVEWTDSTHSALRSRITRFMAVEAAAKADDGKVYLHTVHLASDRQGDSWGPFYGHIMWSDWMAETNVNEQPAVE